jgi:hypothetical protein
MRHPCKECGLTYRYPHDLEEHQRVGCRPQSGNGETWSDKDVEEAPEAAAMEEAAPEIVQVEVGSQPENEEPLQIEEPQE